jgi:hypothetical protein
MEELAPRVWLAKHSGFRPVLSRSFSQTPKSDTPVMLEAHLKEAATLKRLIEGKWPVFPVLTRALTNGVPLSSSNAPYTAIKELVTDANFVCSEEGIKLQAMDNSHVALVAVVLLSEGFVHYRCDHPMPLGVNLASFAKVLKCAKDDDRVALTATDAADVLKLTYEAKSTLYAHYLSLPGGESCRLGMSRTRG